MSKLRLHGTSSGYTDIAPTAAAGNNTLTAPTGTGTIVIKDGSGAIGITSVQATNANFSGTIRITSGISTTLTVGGVNVLNSDGVNTSGIVTAATFVPTVGQLSNRNLMINGAMNVAQRGTSSTTIGYHTLDRFQIGYGGHDEVLTVSQHTLTSSDTGPYAEGFRKSFHVQNGNQTSGADAADYSQIVYRPEGQDINRSGWNFTDPNSKVTLSYWVKSSVAQNFYGFMETSGPTRVFPWETGSLTANTWKKVTVTIPGYASIVIPDTNGTAFSLAFLPFYGTGYTHASARAVGSWYDATPYCPNNTSTWWTTNDSTFEITGIQLEVGSVATPFEHRSYGDELARCQRYYYRAIADTSDDFGSGFNSSTTQCRPTIVFPVTMRNAISAVETTGTASDYKVAHGGTETNCSSVPTYSGGSKINARCIFTTSGLTA